MKRCLIGTFVFFIAVSVPLGALAASQAGGVPSLDDRVTTLETSVINLQASLTSLQTTLATLQTTLTSLQTTVVNIQSNNTALQNALATETAQRKAADAKLGDDLFSEVLTRFNEFNTLDDAIFSETQAREAADADLKSLITAGDKTFEVSVPFADVPNGDTTTIATLGGLPAARYLAIAKGSVANSIHGARWQCDLYADDATTGTSARIDTVFADTTGGNLPGLNVSGTVAALAGVFTLDSPGSMHMDCSSGESGSAVDEIRLIALQLL